MASINMRPRNARPRNRFVEDTTKKVLTRRVQQLFGLLLLSMGVGLGLALFSYSPTDPSFTTAMNGPVHNILGVFGAYVSAPMKIILGQVSWCIPLLLSVWGARFLIYLAPSSVKPWVAFAPLIVFPLSIFAATLSTEAQWGHHVGFGGALGNTLLAASLSVMPVAEWVLLLVSGAVGFIGLAAFCGLTLREFRGATHFLIYGLASIFDVILRAFSYLGGLVLSARARWIDKKDADKKGGASAAAPSAVDSAAPAPLRAAQGFDTPQAPRSAARSAHRGVAPPPLEESAGVPDDVQGEETEEEAKGSRISGLIRAAVHSRFRREDVTPAAPSGPAPRIEPSLAYPAPESAPGGEDHAIDLYDDMGEHESDAPPRALREIRRNVVQHPEQKTPPVSLRAQNEQQPKLPFDVVEESVFELPPLSLLTPVTSVIRPQHSDEALEENARMLETVLDDYGVRGEITSVRPGPVVTLYELEPAPGLKASRVIGLADDIARSMSALAARVSTVPGRSVIGIELPNDVREKVLLREILSARSFGDSTMGLPLALGKDISGTPVVANLAKMPHLLIAGTTGSGKSVAINTMILSLLYKLKPEECRMIMIDPKMLELSVYDGIPHLLSPVVTDPKKAVVALKWVVGEMEDRYRKMSRMGVRNIEGYNGRVKAAQERGEMFKKTVQTGFDEETGDPIFETEEFEPTSFPYIVVVVDEMADLMMVAGKEIEACIQRLAQMARASGIHLIMATQRPSVDVITGTIKANFPTRISFQVTSKIDSRTILSEQGAEQLLGMGDMLYMGNGAKITRIHGPFVSDEEVEEVVAHLKSYGPPRYMSGVVEGLEEDVAQDIDLMLGLSSDDEEDGLYNKAVDIVARDRKCSTSYIQRKLGIGYNKAARLVEKMEDNQVVSSANHVGKREVLVPER